EELQAMEKILATRRRPGESLQAFCKRFQTLALNHDADRNYAVILVLIASMPPETRAHVYAAADGPSISVWSVSGIARFLCRIWGGQETAFPTSSAEPKRPTNPPRSQPYCAYHRQHGPVRRSRRAGTQRRCTGQRLLSVARVGRSSGYSSRRG